MAIKDHISVPLCYSCHCCYKDIPNRGNDVVTLVWKDTVK